MSDRSLKLEVILAAIYLLEFDPMLETTLFTLRDGNWTVQFPQMGPIHWSGEMQHMELRFGAIEISDAKVHRFEIEPEVSGAGKFITLRCSVSFKPNSGRTLALLAELVGETAKLSMEPQRDLLTDAKLDEAEAAELARRKRALDAMVRDDGTTAELRGPDGKTIMRFGENDAPKPAPRKRGRPKKSESASPRLQ